MILTLPYTFGIAATFVATAFGFEPIKLDFEVHRGDSWDNLSIDNEPYMYKRDNGKGGFEMVLGNELYMYIATIKVGSNEQEITLQVATDSYVTWVMSSDVSCFNPPFGAKRSLDSRKPIGDAELKIRDSYIYTTYYETYESYYYTDIYDTLYDTLYYESYYESLESLYESLKTVSLDSDFYKTNTLLFPTFAPNAVPPPPTGTNPKPTSPPGANTKPTSHASTNGTATRNRSFNPEPSLGNSESTGDFGGEIATSNTCIDLGSFETKSSSSFKSYSGPDFYQNYNEYLASAQGTFGQDVVKINGQEVELSFGIANRTTVDTGNLGLGITPKHDSRFADNADLYNTLPAKLKAQGIIEKISYSLYLNVEEAKTGTVLFGAVDHAKYTGQLTTVPIVHIEEYSEETILIPINGIQVTSDNTTIDFTKDSYPAQLETGVSLTFFPSELYYAVLTLLGATEVIEADYDYEIPCPKSADTVTFSFNIGGGTLDIPLTSFITTFEGSSACYLGIRRSEGEYFNLGVNFLRYGYFVYDLEAMTVSVAQVKSTNDENIEVISSDIPSAVVGSAATSFVQTARETQSQVIHYATGAYSMPQYPDDTVVPTGADASGTFTWTSSTSSHEPTSHTEGDPGSGLDSGSGSGSGGSGSRSGSGSSSVSGSSTASGRSRPGSGSSTNVSLTKAFIGLMIGLSSFVVLF